VLGIVFLSAYRWTRKKTGKLQLAFPIGIHLAYNGVICGLLSGNLM